MALHPGYIPGVRTPHQWCCSTAVRMEERGDAKGSGCNGLVRGGLHVDVCAAEPAEGLFVVRCQR